MILIFTNSDEFTIHEVAEWLIKFKIKYLIVDENDSVECVLVDLNGNSFILKIKNETIHSSEIKGIWYRKIPMALSDSSTNIVPGNRVLNGVLKRYLYLEKKTLSTYLNLIIDETVKTIGSSETLYVNKLVQLHYANKLGIKIPNTKIITRSADYGKEYNESDTITKGIYDTFLFSVESIAGDSTIRKITNDDLIDWGEDKFEPSLFQEYVDKKFEVRSFYFKEKFYSMAIFSQNNKKTETDFRNYDEVNPNRMVPFILPVELENKLKKLCLLLNLDTGSFDLIYGVDDEFYFLEVNPVGQFGFVSGLCNYNLEKIMAEYFI